MPLRVGWVDDTAIIRALAVRIIERSGHACWSFPRHADLLDFDRVEPFDVVVLQPEDDVSPHLALQRLLARSPRRAVALASGHSLDMLRDGLGVEPTAFDQFIAKPFDPRRLAAWVASLEPEGAVDAEAGGSEIRIVPANGIRLPQGAPWRRPPAEIVL